MTQTKYQLKHKLEKICFEFQTVNDTKMSNNIKRKLKKKKSLKLCEIKNSIDWTQAWFNGLKTKMHYLTCDVKNVTFLQNYNGLLRLIISIAQY